MFLSMDRNILSVNPERMFLSTGNSLMLERNVPVDRNTRENVPVGEHRENVPVGEHRENVPIEEHRENVPVGT